MEINEKKPTKTSKLKTTIESISNALKDPTYQQTKDIYDEIKKLFIFISPLIAALIFVLPIRESLPGSEPAKGFTQEYLSHKIPEIVQFILALGNLIMLIIWITVWGNKSYSLKFKPEKNLEKEKQSKKDYCNILNLTDDESKCIDVAIHNEVRVNTLVNQFQRWITLYAQTLVVVYLLFFTESIIKLYLEERSAYLHPYFKFFQDVFNFLSAICLYLGFQVLYDKTLDEENKTKNYYSSAAWITGIFLTIYIIGSGYIWTFAPNNSSPKEAIEKVFNVSENYRKNAANKALESISNIEEISKQSNANTSELSNQSLNNGNSNESNSNTSANSSNKKTRTDKRNRNRTDNSEQEIISEQTVQNSAASNSDSNVKGKILSADEINSKLKAIDSINKETTSFQKTVNETAVNDIKQAMNIYESSTSTKVPNVLGLIIGCTNALMMFLLFGRYISMEHLINNTKEGKPYNSLTIGAIYLLPIYALVQPLFGSFEINAFGNATMFANYVFFVCLFGKIFFLYFTKLYMEKRWMHFYLHSVVSYHGVPPKLSEFFEGGYKLPVNEEKVTKETSAESNTEMGDTHASDNNKNDT